MITDEQITDIFKKHGCYIDENMSAMLAVRELIALAQQVKPLEFKGRNDPLEYFWTDTNVGTYEISFVDGEFRIILPQTDYYGPQFKTLDEAIAVANKDYRMRVLSCLVHGGA